MRSVLRGLLVIVSVAGFGSAIFTAYQLFSRGEGIAGYLFNRAVQHIELAWYSHATITEDRYNSRVSSLVDTCQIAIAESYLAVGTERGLKLDTDVLEAFQAARSPWGTIKCDALNVGIGIMTGQGETPEQLGGAIASDLFVIGDIRDLAIAAHDYANGNSVDEVVVVISAIGVGITAGTYASAGGAAPVRIGASILKAAKKAKGLSPSFVRSLKPALSSAISLPVFFSRLKATPVPKSLKGSELRLFKSRIADAFDASVNPTAMSKLQGTFADIGAMAEASGTSTALRILKHVDDPDDLRLGKTFAKVGGKRTAAWDDAFGSRFFKAQKAVWKQAVKYLVDLIAIVFSLMVGLMSATVSFGAKRGIRRYLRKSARAP